MEGEEWVVEVEVEVKEALSFIIIMSGMVNGLGIGEGERWKETKREG